MRCKRGTDFLRRDGEHMFSTQPTQHVPRAFVHGAPIDSRDRATLCAPQKQNEALRFGPGGLRPSPLDAAMEHGGWQERETRAHASTAVSRVYRRSGQENLPDSPPCASQRLVGTNNECLRRYDIVARYAHSRYYNIYQQYYRYYNIFVACTHS